MENTKQSTEKQRVLIDAFFQHFVVFCHKHQIRVLGSHSSAISESVYIKIKKDKEYHVRISAHHNCSKNKKVCDFNFIIGDELVEELSRFFGHFSVPIDFCV